MPRRPQPLLSVATLVGTVAGVLSVAVTLGLLSQAESDVVSGGVQALIVAGSALISALAPVIAAFKARGQVTPVDDPAAVVNGRLVRLAPVD